jgi:hypothetical protein
VAFSCGSVSAGTREPVGAARRAAGAAAEGLRTEPAAGGRPLTGPGEAVPEVIEASSERLYQNQHQRRAPPDSTIQKKNSGGTGGLRVIKSLRLDELGQNVADQVMLQRFPARRGDRK